MTRWLSCWLLLRLSVAVLAGAMLGSSLAPIAASASSDPTWTGSGDGTSWGDSHNWDTMQVPKNGDSVTIGPTSSQFTPHVTGMPSGTQLQNLTLSNASLAGGDVTVMGSFSWDVSGGDVATLAAPLTAQSGASISGMGQENIKDPVTFLGATDVTGPGVVQVQDSGIAITNAGVMTLAPDATVEANGCCTSPDVLVNTGTVSAPGPGTATVGFLDFNGQGSVQAASGSVLDVIGGPGELSPGSGLSGGGGGALSGFGTVTGSVQNSGTVSPSTTGGVLKITGACRQTSSGVLSSVITGTSPGTQSGQLSVGGQATLAGTPQVNTGGGFIPAHGQAFSVLVYHSRSGTFATLSGQPTYTVAYRVTAARVVYP